MSPGLFNFNQQIQIVRFDFGELKVLRKLKSLVRIVVSVPVKIQDCSVKCNSVSLPNGVQKVKCIAEPIVEKNGPATSGEHRIAKRFCN
jgi:hypothetical protein